GIKNVNGTIFVTYAKQLAPDNHDDQAGPGNGFIDEFDTTGNLIERFASGGALNSPHRMAVAPANFCALRHPLLLGHFGDGRINAFDLKTGRFLGQLSDAAGHPLTNPGIWGMTFGNGAGGTRTNTLYFVAGINGENDGLFASISLANPKERKHHSHVKKAPDADEARGGRDQGLASRLVNAADLVFALAGRSAEQQGNAGPVWGFESRDWLATHSAPESSVTASGQVPTFGSKHLGSISAGNVSARPPKNDQGQLLGEPAALAAGLGVLLPGS